MAQKWLEGHDNYRSVRPAVVSGYARDMDSGYWELNGESIKFGSSGELQDGQHRLMACVKSNCNFRSIVVYGISGIDSIDTGAKRSYKDVLARRGEKNSTQLAACILWSYKIENKVKMQGAKVTFSTLDNYHVGNPGLRDANNLFNSKFRQCPLSASKGAALLYLFTKKDPEIAMDFFQSLATGENLQADDPVFALRKTLLSMKMNAKTKHQDPTLVSAYVIKAWNAWREGRSLSRIQWARFGKSRESFPQIV